MGVMLVPYSCAGTTGTIGRPLPPARPVSLISCQLSRVKLTVPTSLSFRYDKIHPFRVSQHVQNLKRLFVVFQKPQDQTSHMLWSGRDLPQKYLRSSQLCFKSFIRAL